MTDKPKIRLDSCGWWYAGVVYAIGQANEPPTDEERLLRLGPYDTAAEAAFAHQVFGRSARFRHWVRP